MTDDMCLGVCSLYPGFHSLGWEFTSEFVENCVSRAIGSKVPSSGDIIFVVWKSFVEIPITKETCKRLLE